MTRVDGGALQPEGRTGEQTNEEGHRYDEEARHRLQDVQQRYEHSTPTGGLRAAPVPYTAIDTATKRRGR
jgi:hypothetical protein